MHCTTVFFCVILSFCVERAHTRRFEPIEPFPPPQLTKNDPKLTPIFDALSSSIQQSATSPSSPWLTNLTSFSVSVTSASETLWTTSHTAPILGNYVDSPATNVTDQTYFRIASISKVFTVLAALIQEQEGKWSLKDPIPRWVPELRNRTEEEDGVAWESITLESLASQLSGIVREYGQSDLTDPFEDRQYGFGNPVEVGLPPVPEDEVPPCGRNRPGERPCSRQEILDGLVQRPPLFQPNYRATYSNMNFVLLGFALESVTGLSYEELINETIFQPLGMQHSRLTKPLDSEGVIPNTTNDWTADIGTYGP
ncbi:MAG: hypothetical protein LQ346_007123 [Caloplaca aetnensis]|nr:MAG: hypothetical protein LQ346_007123 [Caloplaca aetnensis]